MQHFSQVAGRVLHMTKKVWLLSVVVIGQAIHALGADAPATGPSSMPTTLPAPSTEKLPAEKLPTGDLTNLSLEDLMNVQVTSVSRQSQRVADAPAAISG